MLRWAIPSLFLFIFGLFLFWSFSFIFGLFPFFGLFRLFSVFPNKHFNFYNKYMQKVSIQNTCGGIQTHNL